MIRQFKFANGDEIICEVVSTEEGEDEIIVRYAFKLLKIETDPSISYYSFRPWMTLKDEVEDPISINAYHIVAMCNPSVDMLTQYKNAIWKFQKETENSETMDLDAAMERLRELQEEYDRDELDDLIDEESENNIIKFKPSKDKLH